MMNVSELRKEIGKQKGELMNKYDGLSLFLEEINEMRKNDICKSIYRYLVIKYGKGSISEKLRGRIEAITCYPVLEEVQEAAWTAYSLYDFGGKVKKIVKQYASEIQATRR